jgi:carboxylesterase
VACILAHEHPERVDGLALLAPALRVSRAARLAGMLGGASLLAGAVLPKFAGSDVRDPEARRANPCMKGIPLVALRELLSLQREVDRRLPGVAAPALVVIGKRDHTVELSGARRLVRRIGGRPARLVVLPESYHLVGVDVERDRCAEEVLAFFEKIPVPRAARPAAKGGGQPEV